MAVFSLGWSEVESTTNWRNSVDRKPTEVTYDPEDVATEEEAAESACNCIIHSGGRKIMSEPGYMLSYKFQGDEE